MSSMTLQAPVAADADLPHAFSTFTPAELFLISGLSPELQRVWRRRGQLPAGVGSPARFTALEAAEALIRHELSRHGVSPTQTAELAKTAAASVLWHALTLADGACEVEGQEADVERFLCEFAKDDVFRRRLVAEADLSCILWRADDGGFRLLARRDEVGASEGCLSILYIDLSVAGVLLADRARRPLVTVKLPSPQSAPHRTVRRLTVRQGGRPQVLRKTFGSEKAAGGSRGGRVPQRSLPSL